MTTERPLYSRNPHTHRGHFRRAKLQKSTAGHGFPNFVARADLERDGLLQDGCLVVTASKIANVRPREAD